MADPVTLTVLGSWAAAEGIKFLYGQAAEILKAWRERRKPSVEPNLGRLLVPIRKSEALDGTPTAKDVDAAVVDRGQAAMVKLVGALSPYALGQADIDLTDVELANQAGQLRALLEAAYGQRFTFRGEVRESTGSRVSVSQVLGEVAGSVVGAEGATGTDASVNVDQRVDKVTSDGSVTGYKGDIGTH